MIRINLYQGGQKAKKGRRAASPPVNIGDTAIGVFLLLSIVAVVVLTAAANYWYYSKLNSKTAEIQADKARVEQEFRRLSQVKLSYQERERQKELYKKHVDVIDQLRANQSGPVKLLSMLAQTVNKSDDIWLNTMHDDQTAGTIGLKGSALSVHAIADLMRNIQDTGFFKSVDLRSAEQDAGVKDLQVFNFELVCAKQPAQPPAAPVAQAKK